MTLRTRLAAAALLPSAALSACASVDRSGPLADFHDGRYAAARAGYEALLVTDGADDALDRNEAGTIALLQGDVDGARRHLSEGFAAMEDLTSTTGETLGALVGPERTKRWKGDPYERCMNAYYLGVAYWLSGDVDNAAASFKAGVLRDADSEKGEAQSDFALLWFLLGRAQKEARHEDGGRAALAKAHALLPKNPWLDPAKNADANVLVVVDLGFAPLKVASGEHGSVVRFRRPVYRAAYAEVSAGGKPLGRTERAVDVFHQATTRGDKVIDHVNQGKAVFKDAAIVTGAVVLGSSRSQRNDLVGLALIAAGLLTPAEADVRQWGTLPGEVQVLLAKLPPGEHELKVEVRDAGGAPLADQTRTVRVVVREGRTAFVWTRGAPSDAGSEAPRGAVRIPKP
jgi:tetratricopeptide (TPR) repeat protein